MADLIPSGFVPEDPGGTFPNTIAPTAVIPGSNTIENLNFQRLALPKPGGDWRIKLGRLMMLTGAGLGDVYSPMGKKSGAMPQLAATFQAAEQAEALQALQVDGLKALAQIGSAARTSPDAALSAYDQFIQTAPKELDPKIIQAAYQARQTLATNLALVKTTAGLPSGDARAAFIKSAAAAAGPDFGAFIGHITAMANTIEISKPPQAHISGGQLVTWDPKNPKETLHAQPIPGVSVSDTRSVEEKKMEAFAGIYAGESWLTLVKKATQGDAAARSTLARVMAEAEKDPKLNSERDVLAVTMYGPMGTKSRNANVVDLGSLARINPGAAQHVLEEAMLMSERAKGDVAYRIALAQQKAKDEEEPDPAKYRFFDRAKLIKGYAAEAKFATIGEAKKAERSGQVVRTSVDESKALKAVEGLNAVVDTMERIGRGLSPQSGWGVIVQSLSQPILTTLGDAGTPTELGVMQAYNLRIAKILQSAGGTGGGQVSDADARAAAMANINPNDSVESAMIKVGILRKLNHITMLLEAGLSPRDLGITAYSKDSADQLEATLRQKTRFGDGAGVPPTWKRSTR